jgi:von Willebrand factor type A domain
MKKISARSAGLCARGLPSLASVLALGCGIDPSASGTLPSSTNADAGSAAVTGNTGGANAANPPGSAANSAATGTGIGSVVNVAPESNPGAVCQQFTIANGRITPDMLIVLDRSSSMQGEGVDRWTPSVSGLKAITNELDETIRFGLMAFPGRGSDASLGGGMQCAAGTLEVPIALNAAPAIATSLDGLSLIQSTPTATTLSAAHNVLGTGMAQVDATLSAKFVILVTDGAPNCSNGQAGARGGGGGQDPAAVTASVAAIAAMQKDGIKTYVLGYDTQNDAQLKAALDQMAQAGGTGDMAHRPIEDEASLVQEFRRIVGGAVSCEFALTMAPTDPNFVLVQLDGMKLALNGADGFALSADRKKLTVLGSACATLQSQNESHMLTVKVECERQTPLF